MPVVRRAAKPFWSSLLERYWPETEDPSNELGSTVSFKAPVFSYVTNLARLFALAKGWVITPRQRTQPMTSRGGRPGLDCQNYTEPCKPLILRVSLCWLRTTLQHADH